MGVVWEWVSHYWGSLEFPLSKALGTHANAFIAFFWDVNKEH